MSPSDRSDVFARFYPIGYNLGCAKVLKISAKPLKVGRVAPSDKESSTLNLLSLVTSRKQAEIWVENGKVYVKDCGSSSGTFINGQKLNPKKIGGEAELHDGDIIRFGEDLNINGVPHRCEVFMVSLSEKSPKYVSNSHIIAEIKDLAKDNYKYAWEEIVQSVHNDLDEVVQGTSLEKGFFKKILDTIKNPDIKEHNNSLSSINHQKHSRSQTVTH